MIEDHDPRAGSYEGDDAGFSLVMPFVLVQSAGGPYDDTSYVAGWEAAKFDQLCETLPEHGTIRFTSPVGYWEPNVPQLDIIAMRHNLVMAAAPSGEPGWVFVTLSRADPRRVLMPGDPS